jgi:hypothetical protein
LEDINKLNFQELASCYLSLTGIAVLINSAIPTILFLSCPVPLSPALRSTLSCPLNACSKYQIIVEMGTYGGENQLIHQNVNLNSIIMEDYRSPSAGFMTLF